MNAPLPQSAFFLPITSSENNGVDFLGLRQANLDISSVDDFAARGRSDGRFSPFALMGEIQKAFKAKDESFAALSFHALLLCASFAGCFAVSERAAIAVGGASRLSLRQRVRYSIGDTPTVSLNFQGEGRSRHAGALGQ